VAKPDRATEPNHPDVLNSVLEQDLFNVPLAELKDLCKVCQSHLHTLTDAMSSELTGCFLRNMTWNRLNNLGPDDRY